MSDYLYLILSAFTFATLFSFFFVLFKTIDYERLTIENTWLSVLRTHFLIMLSSSLLLPFMFREGIMERTPLMWFLVFVTFAVYGIFLLILWNSKKFYNYTFEELLIAIYYGIFDKEKYRIRQYLTASESEIKDYEQIQDIINYQVKDMSNYEYNKFIVDIFYGYYWCDTLSENYNWISKKDCDLNKFYHITDYKLKCANKSPITAKNSEESEIIATKYKNSFAVIQSIIGKELSSENIDKTVKVIQEYNSKLTEGIQEVQELREKIKKKEQARIKELLNNELEWFKYE